MLRRNSADLVSLAACETRIYWLFGLLPPMTARPFQLRPLTYGLSASRIPFLRSPAARMKNAQPGKCLGQCCEKVPEIQLIRDKHRSMTGLTRVKFNIA